MSNISCDTLGPSVADRRGPWSGFVQVLRHAAGSVVQTLYLWQDRAAQRAHLAGLEDHILKDMGIDRAVAAQEAAKPFWRP